MSKLDLIIYGLLFVLLLGYMIRLTLKHRREKGKTETDPTCNCWIKDVNGFWTTRNLENDGMDWDGNEDCCPICEEPSKEIDDAG